MSGIRNKLVHRSRVRLLSALGIVLVIVATVIVLLILVQQGQLNREPWSYIAVAAGILAALTGFMIALAEGKVESDLTSEKIRLSQARNIRRHHQH